MNEEKQGKSKSPKDSSSRRTKNSTASVEQWINPTPNASDYEWLEVNDDKLVLLVFELLDDLSDDERLSVKLDAYSGRWMAVFFAGSGKARNSQCALSVRGATAFDALILLAYFHIQRFSREWEYARPVDHPRWN